jgi:hypothetical protein
MSLASPVMSLLPYVHFTSCCYCHLIQEIKVTEHVAHIGKSEICTKFCQLKAKISPWKCSICGRMIIELILMLWHQIKCPGYSAEDPQVKWPPLLCIFLAMTSVNFCCQRVKESYGLDSCGHWQGYHEHNNELLYSVRGMEFLDKLNDCYLQEECSS